MKKLLLLSAVILSVIFTGCKKDEPQTPILNTSTISLKFTETHQLILNNTSDKATWSSENPYVAKVDETGLITAVHIGETNILCITGGKTLICKVTVDATYNLYKEPFLDFGASKASIKSKETRMLDSETATSLAYTDSKTKVVGYTFENDKLTSAMVGLSLSTNQDALVGFLTERYDFIGVGDNDVIVLRSDKVFVGLMVYPAAYAIVYMPNTDKKSSSLNGLDATIFSLNNDNNTADKELSVKLQSIFNKQ